MTHVDLFSGLAGFALAARANGLRTVQFVEIEPHCQRFLAKAWPDVPIHPDIRTFDGRKHRGAFLLTAGVPCQPASRAGKQRGKADNRWLWPEAIRVLSEVLPTWALFENPDGLGDLFEFGVQLEMATESVAAYANGVLGDHRVAHAVGEKGATLRRTGTALIDAILGQIEEVGYEVQPVSIPACGLNAPHERERYWILCRKQKSAPIAWEKSSKWASVSREESATDASSFLAHRLSAGLEGREGEPRDDGQEQPTAERSSASGMANASIVRCYDLPKGTGSTAQGTTPKRDGGSRGASLELEGEDYRTAAHPESRGQRTDGSAPGDAGHADERGQGGMGDTESSRYKGETGTGLQGEGRPSIKPDRGCQWDNFVWLPCADGKVRRAPDDSFSVVDGLHRSLLAALGNSIVWPVAAEIIKAMIQAEELTLPAGGV